MKWSFFGLSPEISLNHCDKSLYLTNYALYCSTVKHTTFWLHSAAFVIWTSSWREPLGKIIKEVVQKMSTYIASPDIIPVKFKALFPEVVILRLHRPKRFIFFFFSPKVFFWTVDIKPSKDLWSLGQVLDERVKAHPSASVDTDC